MRLNTQAFSNQLGDIFRPKGNLAPMTQFWMGALREVEESIYYAGNADLYPYLHESRWRFVANRMKSYFRENPENGDRLSKALGTIRNFSQKDPGHFLNYSPFDGRAFDQNAFQLARLFESRHADIHQVLSETSSLLGQDRDRRLETYGAIVGILYGAYVLRIPAQINELDRFKEMRREALASEGRYRLTVIPNDRREGKSLEAQTKTPEWIIEKLDREGKTTRSLAVEVKNKNGDTITEDEIYNVIHDEALRQLLEHKFNRSVPHHDSLIILKFYKAQRAEKRLLNWVSKAMDEVLRLYPSKAQILRRIHIKLIFEFHPSHSKTSWLEYQKGRDVNTWQARQTSNAEDFHPGTNWQEPFPNALRWRTT